jgi:glutamate-1-semialdehyde aminotransferase
LAAYGKVIGGGYPIGVIAGKREFMDALDGGAWAFGDDSTPTVGVTYFAGTFVRHPLALAACHAVLLHLREQGPALQAALTARTTALVESMNQAARAVSAPVEVRQIASLWRIAFTEEHPLQDLLWAMMRDRGIHILDNFPCFLTTAHSDDDCAQVLRAFRDAIAEMQASEFFPPARVAPPEVVNADAPPAANARLGRDRDGSPAWFVPDPNVPGGYVKVAT